MVKNTLHKSIVVASKFRNNHQVNKVVKYCIAENNIIESNIV